MLASRDRSTRFILPTDAPLVANLAALWTADPALAERVEIHLAAASDSSPAVVAPSRTGGDPTLSVTHDGRAVQIHSRYNPRDEARRLVASVDTAGAMLLFIHGLGLGYHVEELFNRASDDAMLFVFEPSIDVVIAALQARDLSRLITTGRMNLVVEANKADLFARLTPLMAGTSLPIVTFKHAPSISMVPRAHAELEQLTADFLAYAKTCVSTLVANGRRTAENIVRNLTTYVSTPGLSRLAGAHRGAPAIIVSAGPSLRKNKHLLAKADGRAVIIAVQTMLQPLLELGVRPQFVTSLDYNEICTRFFEKLPPDLETELVAEPKATGAIFDLFPGPVSLLGNDFAESVLREVRLDKTRLRAGATVAHLAFYLAEHLGCDPIIFVGQDLGFSDGLCYTPGTSYEDVWRPELGRFCTLEMKQWEQIVRDRPILKRTLDHAGRPTYTEERLFTYLQQFERDFAETKARVIDATEGGVLKRGAQPMMLREAIDQFCSTSLSNRPPRHEGLRTDRLPAAIESVRRRRDEASMIADVSERTLPLLEEIRDHLHDQPRVNRAIAGIDELRRRLDAVAPCYELVIQLTQQTELARFKADRAITAAGKEIDPSERQRRQVTRDIENVNGVLEASRHLVNLLADAIDRLNVAAVDQRTGRAA